MTIAKIPELDEYYPSTNENKIALQKALDNIPLEDYKNHLSNEIIDFCKSKNIAELSNIKILKDELSLFEGENKKVSSIILCLK